MELITKGLWRNMKCALWSKGSWKSWNTKCKYQGLSEVQCKHSFCAVGWLSHHMLSLSILVSVKNPWKKLITVVLPDSSRDNREGDGGNRVRNCNSAGEKERHPLGICISIPHTLKCCVLPHSALGTALRSLWLCHHEQAVPKSCGVGRRSSAKGLVFFMKQPLLSSPWHSCPSPDPWGPLWR